MEEETAKRDNKQNIGFIVLGISIILFLINYFFFLNDEKTPAWNPYLAFSSVVLGLIAFVLIVDFTRYFFDNEEYVSSKTIPAIIKKIRFRAVLFNNISILVFIFTLVVIFASFYILVNPHMGHAGNDLYISLTVRIGASVLLVFLVQILFKVFKYLLRVAAFYNARADAIEYHKLDEKIELDKLMDLFTPEKYDITELQQLSIFDSIVDAVKAKIGK